jgi:hypothetical protein
MAVLSALLLAGAFAPPPAAAASAAIHPGVQLFVNSGQCTGGYILADATRTCIAMAANCAITGQPADPSPRPSPRAEAPTGGVDLTRWSQCVNVASPSSRGRR